ncbi:hypothetical protein OG426_45790 [Streptomyces canus]|uniref:hypothetical protein n=1 Tax=Streptomyces canus TaxID=58343 RepID=UPI0038681777|nr:hypothetical protein OG426_45790 [Streptomyces canus]
MDGGSRGRRDGGVRPLLPAAGHDRRVGTHGVRRSRPTVAYIGWFGPRGLASVVFGLLLVEERVPGVHLLGRVIAATVALSILLHGLSAVFLAKRYGAWHRKAAERRPHLREGVPEGGGAGHSSPAR